MTKELDLIIYATADGKEPFNKWLLSLDKKDRNRIAQRINRLEDGNLGDYKNVGDGVLELRFTFGSGYRIYFGKDQDKIIILLCGGDKKTQSKDIIKAKQYWRNYNEQ